MILPLILSLIFFVLAILHFHWAVGGEWGLAQALPTNEKGERILNPRPLDSAIVGIGLTGFALFYILQMNVGNIHLPTWLLSLGGWLIPAIFILRAIGEFKYVGFFKKIKHTTFGQRDTKFYAPLCLAIGVMGLVIQFFW